MSSTVNTQTPVTRETPYLGRTATFVGSPGDKCPNIGSTGILTSLEHARIAHFISTSSDMVFTSNHTKTLDLYYVTFSLGVIALNVECRTLMSIEAGDPREIHAVRTKGVAERGSRTLAGRGGGSARRPKKK